MRCHGNHFHFSEKQKLHEHQTYYKAVTDNGYYPHFRTLSSSTSEDKVRKCLVLLSYLLLYHVTHDMWHVIRDTFSLGCNVLPLELQHVTVMILYNCWYVTGSVIDRSRDFAQCLQVSGSDAVESDGYNPPLSPGYQDNHTRHSSSSSGQDCVRASLQMSLADDTFSITPPRKRADTKSSITPQNSVEPASPGTSPQGKEKSFFPASWPFKIDSFSTRRNDNMNKERTYDQMQFRPRAGSFRQDDQNNVTMVTRCDSTIPEKLTNSYEKYLQTLRYNRQRNDLVNRNFENRRHSSAEWNDHNVNCNGHLSPTSHVRNVSHVTSQHSTAV